MADTLIVPAPAGSPAKEIKGWQKADGSAQIDTTIDIVTPENISFSYRTAGPFRRFAAYVIDFLISTAILIVAAILLALLMSFLAQFAAMAGAVDFMYSLSGMYMAFIMVASFLLRWFYGGIFETFMNGQTPGKWMVGIRVLTTEGEPINGMQAVVRNILRLGDTMPILTVQIFDQFSSEPQFPTPLFPTFMVGLVFMAMNRRFQRVGDIVCGTVVVSEERSWLMGVARVEDPRTAQLAALLPQKFEVSRTLAQALATYVERRQFFSQARRREIARHLGEPLLRMFGMPADTSHDLLLCALYYRTFIADKTNADAAPAFAAAQYGAPPYGAPAYGAPPYGAPPMPPDQQGINFDPPPMPQQTMARPTGPIQIRE